MRWLSVVALSFVFAATASAATVDGLKIHSTSAGAAARRSCSSTAGRATPRRGRRRCRCSRRSTACITLDLPGHGQSGAPKDGKFSMDLFARAVEAVRAEAGTDKIVLVGHSMGAPVIRQYARLYPAARGRARRRGRSARHAAVPGRLQAAAAHRPRGAQGARRHDPRHVHAADAAGRAAEGAGDDAQGAGGHRDWRDGIDDGSVAAQGPT